MRILFVSRDFSGASLCLRLVREGNEVRVHVADPRYRQIMDGLVEKVDDLDAGINWVGRDGPFSIQECVWPCPPIARPPCRRSRSWMDE